MGKIPVKALYDYTKMMLDENWGYIWGTAGIKWTQARQDKVEDEMAQKYGSKWIGHMVTDCSGVMVYIWKQYGLKIPHGSSSMVREGYIVDCGPTPHPGWAALVDETPDTPDNKHIGIVGADGVTVYEAKGTQAGFVTSKVTDKKWVKFGRFKDVDYGEEEEVLVPPVSDTYFAEITGDNVRLRSGPGTNYAKVGDKNLYKGDQVEVLADCGNWKFCKVLSDLRQGYIFSKYVSDPITKEVDPVYEDEKLVDELVVVDRDTFVKIVELAKEIVDKYGKYLEVYNG